MPLLSAPAMPPSAAALFPTAGLLVLAFVLAAVWWLSGVIARWGQDSPVPTLRPPWLGPDAAALEGRIRLQLDARRTKGGAATLPPHPVVDELARHHAHDMAERRFCGPTDPEGVDLDERHLRLHPRFVGRLEAAHLEVEVQPGWGEERIARELLDSPGGGAEAVAALVASSSANCLGVGVGTADRRAVLCLVASSHWADLVPASQAEAEPDTWAVEGELGEGMVLEELSFVLRDPTGREHPVTGPVPTTDDDWEAGRFRILVPALPDLAEARLVARRGNDRSRGLPLP